MIFRMDYMLHFVFGGFEEERNTQAVPVREEVMPQLVFGDFICTHPSRHGIQYTLTDLSQCPHELYNFSLFHTMEM